MQGSVAPGVAGPTLRFCPALLGNFPSFLHGVPVETDPHGSEQVLFGKWFQNVSERLRYLRPLQSFLFPVGG